MLKIAIVGTHGVGKTTLAYELAGVLKRRGRAVELVAEVARECPLPLNDQATVAAHQWVIARQVQLEIERGARCEVLVCDRSVLDNYAYYVRLFGESKALGAYCREWTNTYDLLARLHAARPLVPDGFRSTSEEFQREIDLICDELFERKVRRRRAAPAYVRGDFGAEELAELLFRKAGEGRGRDVEERAESLRGRDGLRPVAQPVGEPDGEARPRKRARRARA